MSIELIAIVVALVVGVGFYLSAHKQTEAKLLAELATVKSQLVNLWASAGAHTVSLDDIQGLLTAHGLSLATLEDKAKNAMTELEKTKAIQELEAAAHKVEDVVKQALALRDALVGPASAAADPTPVPATLPSAATVVPVAA